MGMPRKDRGRHTRRTAEGVDMIDLFQEISDLDTTVIRKTLSVKQDVAQTIKISEKTKEAL